MTLETFLGAVCGFAFQSFTNSCRNVKNEESVTDL